MMTLTQDSEYSLEQGIYIDGEMDGYDGVKPKHLYTTYLQAYIAGCRRKLEELQRQLAEFQQETAWLDEF
ncbi:hypothetical protein AB3R30_15055 [Leptolyngbyaceae cyanobacterium UHCC 1019]